MRLVILKTMDNLKMAEFDLNPDKVISIYNGPMTEDKNGNIFPTTDVVIGQGEGDYVNVIGVRSEIRKKLEGTK